ncbi:MAG TPA: ABC transporter permease [Candidatus Limnocylindria bacterium]
MRRYIARRLLYAIPTLLAISLATFLLTRLSPGDPIRLYTFGDPNITEEDRQALAHAYGLDLPLPQQYLNFLAGAVKGDFGESILYHKPAGPLVIERLGITMQLAAVALLLQFLIGVPLGVLAALRRGTWIDGIIRVFGVVGHAVPSFGLGLLMIILFSVTLRWLPSQGYLTIGHGDWDVVDRFRHMLMPAFVLALTGIANYSRYLRAETLDVLRQDFIRTAHAKGLRESVVTRVHALRNALIPVVTALGGLLAFLVSGAVVIEQVFTWPGIGQFAYNSVRQKDFPVIIAAVMISSVLLVVGYLVRDILYAVADPRIKVS